MVEGACNEQGGARQSPAVSASKAHVQPVAGPGVAGSTKTSAVHNIGTATVKYGEGRLRHNEGME